MKKLLWEGIQLCEKFVETFFCLASGSFKGEWVVYHEEGRTSWFLDPFIPDTVDPCCCGFIILVPRGYGAVINMC